MRQAMEYSLAFGLPIIDHCEDEVLSEGGQMNEGIIATKLGLCGIPAAAEVNIIARDIALARLTGARLHIAHVSTEASVELLRKITEKSSNASNNQTANQKWNKYLLAKAGKCLNLHSNFPNIKGRHAGNDF